MLKKKGPPVSKAASEEKPATLKDLLSPDILNKLKMQTDALKAEEEKRKDENKKIAEEARRAEQKLLENDFEHLLKNSSQDWKKYK